MIRLTVLEGNTQKLDGGAMFGNVPRAVWKNWLKPDEDNRIELACRGLLLETDSFKILLETGIGVFMPPKLRKRYGVEPQNHQLLQSLTDCGVDPLDITHVLLTHLHFDHAGGLLTGYRESGDYKLVFPNARFLIGKTQWERANHPHSRDRASFIPELHQLLKSSERLQLLSGDEQIILDQLTISFFISQGHTPGMLCPIIEIPGRTIMCPADMIPGRPWVHLPVTMGYDRFPEQLIEEKTDFLSRVLEKKALLFFLHDPRTPWCEVVRSEKGAYAGKPVLLDETGQFLLNQKNDLSQGS